ncbi:MAG TPA: four-carbon acid sugar kinase family protein [Thermomicrobiaceae bacterium]|nr:four-carbon acid sugar kinase family protein [Thermomicrobiaceae bacterium]
MSRAARVIIVADDLTGAADTAAAFARHALTAMIDLGDGPLPEADVVAVSTESRHLAPDLARRRVTNAAARLRRVVHPTRTILYKKVDSTLRGNPADELDALMDALGLELALAAPAFPAQGRTTVGGRQRVDGRPLEETPLAREVPSSRLDLALVARGRTSAALDLAAVRGGAGAIASAIGQAGRGVVVADAESEADLATLVEGSRRAGVRLLCGSAGLAAALGAALGVGDDAAQAESHASGPVLLVIASRHPRTLAQLRTAEDAGIPVLSPSEGALAGDDGEQARVVERAARLLARQRVLALTTAGHRDLPGDPLDVARNLAGLVRRIARVEPPGALILTGGDVADAVCRVLGARAIRVLGEVEPGIPWGTLVGGDLDANPVVTKAGGFGGDDFLVTALRSIGGAFETKR